MNDEARAKSDFPGLHDAACFRAADRYAFLYKIVWRWQAGQRDVLSAADEDGARLHAMVKTIRRETHKMNAYLRFREQNPNCFRWPRQDRRREVHVGDTLAA